MAEQRTVKLNGEVLTLNISPSPVPGEFCRICKLPLGQAQDCAWTNEPKWIALCTRHLPVAKPSQPVAKPNLKVVAGTEHQPEEPLNVSQEARFRLIAEALGYSFEFVRRVAEQDEMPGIDREADIQRVERALQSRWY